jgi:hypothetical protein
MKIVIQVDGYYIQMGYPRPRIPPFYPGYIVLIASLTLQLDNSIIQSLN